MLLVIHPVSDIFISICVVLGTSSLHLSVGKISLVPTLVGPHHHTLTFHVVILEISLVYLTCILEVVSPVSLKLAINEVTVIEATLKLKLAFASLLAVYEVPSILYCIEVPALSTKAILDIVLPVTFVHTATCVDEYSMSVGLAVFPFTVIDVTVCVSHST